jgi:hypothetical protein
LSEATLHIGETEEGLGRKKYDMVLVQMVLFENGTACNAKVCLTILKSFKYGYKELNIPCKS